MMVAAKGAMPDSRACAKRALSKAWGFGDNTIERSCALEAGDRDIFLWDQGVWGSSLHGCAPCRHRE